MLMMYALASSTVAKYWVWPLKIDFNLSSIDPQVQLRSSKESSLLELLSWSPKRLILFLGVADQES